jgi:hypothetical protein
MKDTESITPDLNFYDKPREIYTLNTLLKN